MRFIIVLVLFSVIAYASSNPFCQFETYNSPNGDLLKAAENKGYKILVTTDQNLRYQQNLSERQIAIIVLLSTSWPKIRTQLDKICSIINTTELGDYQEISII